MGAEDSRPLRILMTADTIGGVWQFAVELARALTRHGDHVVLAAMGDQPSLEQQRDVAACPGVELRARTCRLVWMRDPWADVEAAGGWLQSLAEEFRPDVVHLNDFGHGHLSWPAPVLVTGHSCVCSWWQAVHGREAPAEWNRYRERVRAALRNAAEVVAPTRAMLATLHRHYGWLPSTRVIPNGRTLAGNAAFATKAPVVLAAGRLWDEAKNLAALAAVAPRLSWPVYVAGEVRAPDGSTTTLANVHALGHLPDEALHGWMARASIYALPARYEPFGLSALEAAQQGCALVLGDIDSLHEVWGDAAMYVPPEKPAALENALLRLIRDGDGRRRMAQRARARAARYRPSAMAAGYRASYLKLAGKRPGTTNEPPALDTMLEAGAGR